MRLAEECHRTRVDLNSGFLDIQSLCIFEAIAPVRNNVSGDGVDALIGLTLADPSIFIVQHHSREVKNILEVLVWLGKC